MTGTHYDAAGGVVYDGQNRVLILFRPSRDEVRLPKGHVEAGESAQQAALREVTEESGYADLAIVADLGQQAVEFTNQLGQHTARDEHYFLMRLKSDGQIERDPHEHQFIPLWLTWEQAQVKLTYPAEHEWLRRAKETYDKLDLR